MISITDMDAEQKKEQDKKSFLLALLYYLRLYRNPRAEGSRDEAFEELVDCARPLMNDCTFSKLLDRLLDQEREPGPTSRTCAIPSG